MGKRQAAPGARKSRRTNPQWRTIFLGELARTSNVAASARRARVDVSTAYKTRRSETRFAREWFEALCEGYDNLEMDLLHRLREGELEGSTAKPRARRKYDNATAFRLLAAHRAAVVRQRARREDQDEEAVYASITAKLETMRQRLTAVPALLERTGAQPPTESNAQ
jgi:hypothetical protein